ncbi:MAG: hypothetical protein KY432_01085 [Acidobacteria bacterium]|nr:hypothetical protein [Acidobacteriota bacterium]
MSTTTRMILFLTLMTATIGLAAQETATTGNTVDTSAEIVDTSAEIIEETAQEPVDETASEAALEPETSGTPEERELSPAEVRSQFTSLLVRHPRNVATVLAHDPLLLQNDSFLARYPEIAQFVATHPEIRDNPSYYLFEFRGRVGDKSILDDILDFAEVLAVLAVIACALGWLLRTIIEQKRWNRLSQTQSEVHNKILDRFGTSEELLEYIKTPAGTKFLESAPIPLHSDKPARSNPLSSPLTRMVWSIQLGVVIAVASLGMLLVSFRFSERSGDELFAFGLIGFCVGAGFIASAAVSLIMSQRLGLWDPSRPTDQPSAPTDPGTVR